MVLRCHCSFWVVAIVLPSSWDALEALAVVMPAAVAAAEAALRHVRAGDDEVDAVGVARQPVADARVDDALQQRQQYHSHQPLYDKSTAYRDAMLSDGSSRMHAAC